MNQRRKDLEAFWEAGRFNYPELIDFNEAKMMAETRVRWRFPGWRIYWTLLSRIRELESK